MAVILVTGASDGLGRYVATELARAGHRVVAHGRSPDRLAALAREVDVETVQADLAELRQVDGLADRVFERCDRLDVLVNNAGIGAGPDPDRREKSADGIELRFAVNYLAGFHLTRRLVSLLEKSAPSRVVNVASAGQRAIDFSDPLLTTSYDGKRAYNQSKLAQIMFTIDLAEELQDRGVTVNALHPATLMPTTMVREGWPGRAVSTLEEGGRATLRLVTDAELAGVTGAYFNSNEPQPARANEQAYDADARRRLRRLSEELISAAAR